MKRIFYVLFILSGSLSFVHAQTNTFPSTGAAGIGTTAPDASSLLEINSTTKGLLIPRMTQAQRNGIVSPAKGLMIYQTNNTQGFYFYNGSKWVALAPTTTTYTAGQGISITNGIISNLGDVNAGDDITVNTSAGGDLVGMYPSPTVSKLHGVTLYPVAPTNGQVLKYNGQYWIPSADDNTTYMAGNGLSLNGTTFTNTAPDQTVTLTGSGATTVSGTYPNFTISSIDNNTTYNAGNGLSLSGNTFTNTAPDQTVSIGAGSGINVTGTYPNFAISSTVTQGWSLNGNAGTDASTNFLGTTDAQPLVFKVNNTSAGRLQTNGQTFLGLNAGNLNSTGAGNNAFGQYSLGSNTTGSENTAIGDYSLSANTTGSNNSVLGALALFFNTGGYSNTAIGQSALYLNSTGVFNTACGKDALLYNDYGSFNTAMGSGSISNNINGTYNTGIGGQVLLGNTTGSSNTAIGYAADVNYSNLSNTTALGTNALTTSSNQVRVGNFNVTSIGGYANWTNISDGRVKKNIKQNVPGLAFINKLQPITYNLNLDAADKIVQRPPLKEKEGKIVQSSAQDVASRKAKEAIVYTGFVAQDVEKAAKSLNYDFSGVDAAKNDKDLYGLRYSDFVVPLVKAVQQLSKMNDDKDARIDDLQKQIDELKAMIVSNQSMVNNQQSTIISSASLAQNIPNPFTNTTVVNYTLPQKFSFAQIVITDKGGKTLKALNVSGNKGNVKIDASTLSGGAYQYSLIVDGRLIDTKQMIRSN